MARVKGRKLVVVPTLTLKEQWLERIAKHIPQYRQEIDVQTYHAYEKIRDKEYSLVVFDECQHLPADTFVRLATLKADLSQRQSQRHTMLAEQVYLATKT